MLVQEEVVQGLAAVVELAGQMPSVVHAECHAEVVVAVVVCPMLAMVREPMSRRRRISTLVVVAISMP